MRITKVNILSCMMGLLFSVGILILGFLMLRIVSMVILNRMILGVLLISLPVYAFFSRKFVDVLFAGVGISVGFAAIGIIHQIIKTHKISLFWVTTYVLCFLSVALTLAYVVWWLRQELKTRSGEGIRS